MTAFGYAVRSTLVVVVAAIAGIAADDPAAAAAPPDKVLLAPHRAVYQLKLLRSTGSRGIDGVRGRILYDFSGNSCDGYDLQFRQVSELDSGEGKSALSDLQATTWEDGAAKKFRFNSETARDFQVGSRCTSRISVATTRRASRCALAWHSWDPGRNLSS